MKTTELLDIVRKQRENLNNFHEVVLLKQQALIVNDLKGIEGAIAREEKLISLIERTEKSRIEILGNLKKHLNLQLSSNRINEFLSEAKQYLDAKLIKMLERETEIIEQLVEEIQLINQQNQFLINNAREFIKGIINAVTRSGSKAIFDRKI